MPEAEREFFIRDATSDDRDLGVELAALVQAYREDDDFLEPSANPPLEEDAHDGDPLSPGARLAHYVIESEIGRGGMGVVYLARDTRLERPVALKALNPRLLSDPKQIERFRREARAAASLRHPAIATVHALEEQDGRFYIVAEYLPGGRLGAEIPEGGLPIAEALSIVRQIAEGLAEAHARGVVHRDLKPDNIILDASRRPKLVDFGLAVVATSMAGGEQKLTRTGFLLGTPGYISPEQLEGLPGDARSDQFALGVVLVELMTGRNPFLGTSVAATVAAILRNEPGMPPSVPDAVARIARRCIDKNPERRYGSMEDLSRDLGNAQRGLTDPQPGTPQELPAPNGRRLHAYWWNFHQTVVLLLYGAMIGIGWLVLEQGSAGWTMRAIFFAILASAIGAGTLRAHLLFTWRFNADALSDQLRRTRPWLIGTDALFSVALMLGALWAMPVSSLAASAFAAVSVGHAFAFFFVEPTTTRTIFPAR